MAMVFTDAKHAGNPIIFANDSFVALSGYTREEILGQQFNFLLAHGADAASLNKSRPSFTAIRIPVPKFSIGVRTRPSFGQLSL